jgi:hypothetical protein
MVADRVYTIADGNLGSWLTIANSFFGYVYEAAKEGNVL